MSDTYTNFFGTEDLHEFSFYQRPVKNTIPMRAIEVPDVYRYIKGPYAKVQTETLRSITDKDEARQYKATHFDYVTFSGLFKARGKNDLVRHSELLCIDFDHIKDIPALKEKLLNDPCFETELLFRSPSGDGLKWVIEIERQGWEHSRFYNAVYNYLVASGYPEPDKSGSDVARSCFLPYDPDIFINNKYNHVNEKTFFTGLLGGCPF